MAINEHCGRPIYIALPKMLRQTFKRTFSKGTVCLANCGKPQNPAVNPTIEMKIEPIERTGESLDTKRARLVYQLRKRGILESDLLLSRFAKRRLRLFTPEQLDEYDKLLDEADWDIYYWATKNYDVTPLPAKWQNSEILKLLQHDAENKEKEILRMPEL